jgi:histidinol-phosphate aminotransferase
MATSTTGRNYLIDALEKNNYEYYPQSGNFIFIKPHLEASLLAEKLKEKKILIKTYGSELLKNYIRINTGSPAIMEQFVNTLLEVDKQ